MNELFKGGAMKLFKVFVAVTISSGGLSAMAKQDPEEAAVVTAADQAAAAAEAALEALAEVNLSIPANLNTLERCLMNLNAAGKARPFGSYKFNFRGIKYSWNGSEILNSKTNEIIWSKTVDELRGSRENKPIANTLKKIVLNEELRRVQRISVDRTTPSSLVRSIYEAYSSCDSLSIKTYGLGTVADVALNKTREIKRIQPSLFVTRPTRRAAAGSR